MYTLGISAYYHDSAACLIYKDEIISAAQEERFTRIKQDKSFPLNAIKYCLTEAGLDICDITALVYYEKPFLKFERLLESYYHFAPKGIVSFVKSIPIWIKEKLFIKNELHSELKKIGKYDKKKLKIFFSEHHLSHAASAYYPSGFASAAILTLDGMGEWASASIASGKGNKIEILQELHYPNSLGLLYSAFTYFIGFMVNSGEYKLMGLAPYGNHGSEQVEHYKKLIRDNLVEIKPDGSIRLEMKYFAFATGLKMVHTKKWESLFNIKKRNPSDDILQSHSDLALAIQQITEEIVLNMAREAKRLTGSKNLCMAGGVALNCVANSAILKEKLFDKIFIQPASGDAGGSLGAALAFVYLNNDYPIIACKTDKMKGAFLGPEFSDSDVLKVARKYGATWKYFEDDDSLFEFTSNKLIEGKVTGWFRGRMEFGPRALGNRSILADARNPEMQKKLNLKIKFREGFRPFAPSVLNEDKQQYFNIDVSSPYMLYIADVTEDLRNALPDNYESLDIMSKLYIQRSSVPTITHCDFSARLQTVHKETNPDYHKLILKFKELTGTGLIVNTSFNVRGEPIVCTPSDAFRCFMRTEMDVLVLQNYVFIKENQNINNKLFNENFKPD
ncbi:MAG: carbamoyltransferase [Bacteroidales bacterium]|nr:carbamoyltransferase [Bacteroidales bacterium]MDD4216324.1 carbamoyltransferase [Bacteroidales bacterium]MDY0140873.1 carbamoyltransferase [Bacteroidales bacterium]